MHEMRNGKNVYPKNSQLVTVGACNTNIKTSSTDAQLDDPLNEGCVDVAHLKGYYTLHRNDMKRRVLCVPELKFCPTPNHALLVDDKWTSLKKLCTKEGWECTEEERMVNNLNVFFRTRLRFNDRIVITLYDAYWPIFATVIGKIIEITWNIVLKIVNLIVVVSLLLLAHGFLATNGQLSMTGTTPLEKALSRTPRGVQKFATDVLDSLSGPSSLETNEDGTDLFATPNGAVRSLLAISPRVVLHVTQFGIIMIEKIRGNAEVRRIEYTNSEEKKESCGTIFFILDISLSHFVMLWK